MMVTDDARALEAAAARLPAEARAKLRALQQAAADAADLYGLARVRARDAEAAAQRLRRTSPDAEQRLDAAKARLSELRALAEPTQQQQRLARSLESHDIPALVVTIEEIDAAAAEADRAAERARQAGQRHGAAAQLLGRVTSFVGSRPPGRPPLAAVPPPALTAADPAAELGVQRERVASLRAELAAAERAPDDPDEIRAAAEAFVARRGARAQAALDGLTLSVASFADQDLMPGAPAYDPRRGAVQRALVGEGQRPGIPAFDLIAWLAPAAVEAALQAAIDVQTDTRGPPRDETRIASLRAELDAAERIEEALVAATGAPRRKDASPAAVLGVALAEAEPQAAAA